MFRKITFIVGALLLYAIAFSQHITVSASAEKQSILIGEQFYLTIQAEIPKGKEVNFNSIDSIPHFEILEKLAADSQVTTNGLLIRQRLLLTSWDSGRWMIPAISFGQAKTKPFPVAVLFSPFDSSQPYHDIKDIIQVQKPAESRWWWYVIGIALLLALFLLFFPKGKKKEDTEFVSDESAYKKAMKRLQQLRSGKNEVLDAKEYYTTLVDIFREYLHKRKNIQSFSQTTDDLAVQMKSLAIKEEDYRSLVQTLRLSDMVKYARYIPREKENIESLDNIERSITLLEEQK